jgi:hypothetical protein
MRLMNRQTIEKWLSMKSWAWHLDLDVINEEHDCLFGRSGPAGMPNEERDAKLNNGVRLDWGRALAVVDPGAVEEAERIVSTDKDGGELEARQEMLLRALSAFVETAHADAESLSDEAVEQFVADLVMLRAVLLRLWYRPEELAAKRVA